MPPRERISGIIMFSHPSQDAAAKKAAAKATEAKAGHVTVHAL